MKIQTKRDLLKSLPKRWRDSGPGSHLHGYIYRKLLAQKELTEQKARDIIGNYAWTRNECSECKGDSESVAVFSSKASLCEGCLKKAIKKLEK